MKIVKFRIYNYKSIVDSGDCYLTDNVTILAGKNESGKTSILEALEDFDIDNKIKDDAIPIGTTEKPKIALTFELTADEVKEVTDGLGINIPKKGSINITLVKDYPDSYSFGQETVQLFSVNTKAKEVKKDFISKYNSIKKVASKYPNIKTLFFDLNIDSLEGVKEKLTSLNQQISSHISEVVDQKDNEALTQGVADIIQESDKLVGLDDIESKFIQKFTKNHLFNMILFSSFDDEFPHTIPLTELPNNEWANDLAEISDFSIETVTGTNARSKKQHKTQINIEFKGKFQKYWTQDPISLEVDWDSQKVEFWIEENGNYYEPKQRSKGQQWHLAYYVKVGARAREDVPNIILIDEPGLYLHAKAQRDVLNSLEDHAKDTQVIFSTHSPYLIESDKLNRVRLIEKNNEGTKIFNKLHVLADRETLTPVLTAIGLGVNDGIQNIAQKNNVVVEGPADVFYLQSFKLLVKDKLAVSFISGGGAGNMPFIGAILQGWGGNVIYLFDNDQAKKDGERNLTKKWYVTSDLILSVLDDKSGAIEDIFSLEDFKKYVLNNESLKYKSNNSEHVNKAKKDKVLLARLFLQRVEKEKDKIKLSKETIDNIKKLFNILGKKFEI